MESHPGRSVVGDRLIERIGGFAGRGLKVSQCGRGVLANAGARILLQDVGERGDDFGVSLPVHVAQFIGGAGALGGVGVVWRTVNDGAVTVIIDDKGIRAETFRTRKQWSR